MTSTASSPPATSARDGGARPRPIGRILVELGAELSGVESPREAASFVVDAADRLFGWDACAVDLLGDPNTSYSLLTIDTLGGERREVPTAYQEIKPESMFRRTLDHGAQIILRDPEGTGGQNALRAFGDKSRPSMSLMFVPIRRKEQNVGLLTIQSYTRNLYTEDDLMMLQVLADYCGGALARTFAESRLRQSEHRLRLLTEQVPAILWTTDRDLRVTASVGSGLRALGLQSSMVAGSTLDEFFQTGTGGASVIALHRRVLDGDLANTDLQWGDRSYQAHIEPLRDETGSIIGCIGVAHDMTERLIAEQKREQTLEELARSNADLEQYAYVASHDLQEPLRMVASYVQLLARRYKGKLDPDADEFIGYAVDGVNRMQQLIMDLLAYSRVDAKGKQFEPVDLNASLDKAVKNLRLAIADTGAEIHRGPLPTVLADPSQMTQLFQNLIGNAIKFRRREEPPRIRVAAVANGREAQISVADNGLGIPADAHQRIFMIFQRLQNRKEYPGTGIGLALCKRIVERHHGRIWVESTPGSGSVFSFSIRAREALS